MNKVFSATKLNISYKDKKVLEDVSAYGCAGEFVGLLGESGSGKSTFSKALCGLLNPESGEISAPKLPKVQMIYQNPWGSLDPVQKIGKGLEELISYHKMGDARVIIPELLGKVQLGEEILTHLPSQISGGEAARVCIARALLFKPELLIMDEATSMLDTETQKDIINLVKRTVTDNGGCVLFISHDTKVVHDSCSRIYLLENKKLMEI